MTMIRFRTKKPDGLPAIHWLQDVPTGETVGSRKEKERLKAGAMVGLFAGIAARLAFDSAMTAVVVGVLAGGMIAAPGPMRPWVGLFGRERMGPWPLTQSERDAEALRRVSPICERQMAWSEVRLRPGSEALELVVWHVTRDEAGLIARVPLESFDGLEIGTAEEWFGDMSERELVRLRRAPGQWVIVAVTRGHGVVVIGRSGRDKAEMAVLHQALSEDYVASRRELRQWLEDRKGRVA